MVEPNTDIQYNEVNKKKFHCSKNEKYIDEDTRYVILMHDTLLWSPYGEMQLMLPNYYTFDLLSLELSAYINENCNKNISWFGFSTTPFLNQASCVLNGNIMKKTIDYDFLYPVLVFENGNLQNVSYKQNWQTIENM